MANQYTKNETQRDRIIDYVEKNPRCLSRAIADALDIKMHRVVQEMAVLQNLGRVKGEQVQGQKGREWVLLTGYSVQRADKPRIVINTDWSSHKRHARDEWHCLFFGAAA